MNRPWLVTVFIIAFALLGILKAWELRTLKPFFKAERVIKLSNFKDAKKGLSSPDLDLLELWESMLTGRSAPLAKWMKERYRLLGLNHLFTPSGFHLSAVLLPFMKFIQNKYHQLGLLISIGVGLIFVPGQAALKRMVLIKSHQKLLGLKSGFILALLLDILFGSFQSGALSFSYSFLFLGIIYSGAEGIGLAFWFFLGQIFLAYFQGNHVSPLLLLVSPILNLAFGMAMPLLFILAFPLWQWQLKCGLLILEILQKLVDISATFIGLIPSWEIHFITLLLIVLFLFKKWKHFSLSLLLLSNNLNLDLSKEPTLGTYEFVPQGEVLKVYNESERDMIYFTDGKCERKLVRGFWWEKCSPKRRSTKRKKN